MNLKKLDKHLLPHYPVLCLLMALGLVLEGLEIWDRLPVNNNIVTHVGKLNAYGTYDR